MAIKQLSQITQPFLLLTITVYDPALPGTRTLYFTDQRGFRTTATDTPASTVYEGRILNPGTITKNVLGAWTGGKPNLGLSSIELANRDGFFNYLRRCAFDGWSLTMDLAWFENITTMTRQRIFTGTMQQPDIGAKIVIPTRSPTYLLDKPVLTTTYAGTGTLEGDSTIQGRLKPRGYGYVWNGAPVPVDTTNLIYQGHDRQTYSDAVTLASIKVFDAGVELTADVAGNYASQADMYATLPAIGRYRPWVSASGIFIRLRSLPAGQVTMNFNATPFYAVLSNPLSQFSQVAAQLIYADANTGFNYYGGGSYGTTKECGLYITDGMTYAQAFAELVKNIGGWWGFIDGDAGGPGWRVGNLATIGAAPTPGATDVFITDDQLVGDVIKLGDAGDPTNGVPPWRLTFNYQKNETVQSSGLSTSVTADRRAFVGAQYRSVQSQDTGVLTQWPLAIPIIQQSNVAALADAQSISDSLYAALKDGNRKWYKFTCRFVVRGAPSFIEPGMPVYVYLFTRKGGLSINGTAFVPYATQFDVAKRQVSVIAWTGWA